MQSLPIRLEPRALGKVLRVFPIAYGCWRFAGTALKDARAKIDTALDLGIDLFDHADIYGGDGAAEDLFGRVLAETPSLRQKMVIATKGGIVQGVPYDSGASHLVTACEGSLKRLRTDVIDLYQIHRPDLLTHPHELAGALDRLRREGKVREVGVSNFTRTQFDALQHHLPFPIVAHQPEFSAWVLAPLRDGVLDQCQEHDVTPLAWSPLARGLLGLSLPAARQEPEGERLAALLENLDVIAARENVSRSAVALAWILVHPSRPIPIVGTQRLERIRESLDAFRVHLSRRDWYAVLEASQGEKLP